MENPTKMRVKQDGSRREIQVLIHHPMRAAPQSGKAADMIGKLVLMHNGKLMAEVYSGENVADNPLFSLGLCEDVAPGDTFGVQWCDTHNVSGRAQVAINRVD